MQAKWDDGHYYPGKVVDRYDDNTYKIAFSDGDERDKCPHNEIREPQELSSIEEDVEEVAVYGWTAENVPTAQQVENKFKEISGKTKKPLHDLLREFCRTKGLKVSGTNAELCANIVKYYLSLSSNSRKRMTEFLNDVGSVKETGKPLPILEYAATFKPIDRISQLIGMLV